MLSNPPSLGGMEFLTVLFWFSSENKGLHNLEWFADLDKFSWDAVVTDPSLACWFDFSPEISWRGAPHLHATGGVKLRACRCPAEECDVAG